MPATRHRLLLALAACLPPALAFAPVPHAFSRAPGGAHRTPKKRAQQLPSPLMSASPAFSTQAAASVNPTELSLGAPKSRPKSQCYDTAGGVRVNLAVNGIADPEQTVERLIDALDSRQGALFASSYEFPGRYARWTLGFVNPPLRITGRGRDFTITALNSRGKVLLPAVEAALSSDAHIDALTRGETELVGLVSEATEVYSEEERSKQPSLFSVVRAITAFFGYEHDPQLGLYGSFGYDLTFQFEPIDLVHERSATQRDLVLYLPDQIIVVDTKKKDAWELRYDFTFTDPKTQEEATTNWMARDGDSVPYRAFDKGESELVKRDSDPGAFAERVQAAKAEFKVGNLFEAVLSQTFREPCEAKPSQLFRRLRRRNPAPYGFLLNLGSQEYLVGASPEMFVRCEKTPAGIRVETCPISGTIARGADALEDAQRIKAILGNLKEESELTMCTDVDRNDKSRICVPGSVRVIGRRQIEMYSRLIHTVDHVEGYLREGFDALDAFLCHTWAVTVTGAPKTWAIQFVERQEASPREWYGGAVGLVGFDGHLNTGLTLRTVHVKNGIGNVRAGATLLFDSDPEAEEKETELKASAMLDALTRGDEDELASEGTSGAAQRAEGPGTSPGTSKGDFEGPVRVLLIDHEDSFVHTLANYLRQTGAEVSTVRSGQLAMKALDTKPDMVVLSPGPGNPSDFGLKETIAKVSELKIPAFGVCLGLQGMCEFFGGKLGVLDYPMHGKPSPVFLTKEYLEESDFPIFQGLPDTFEVARYHSLHALPASLPDFLRVTAVDKDGVVMALEHKELPFAAVQFHPESILTNPSFGLAILSNAINVLQYKK
eukprot:CAMPEP_0172582350 /NCGR_PEP_ID=MMETSP1068-20121228/1770_1 /TAXON_ID=35684 /ORGANISM="Pseudopedinella elastica, Strain CCMP716" /LENGTH=831 /DNA_ID=CAMNT_0013375675 /DNA_START=47 /DNA_END=2542 /DNA_ORIENTATION=-